MKTYIIATCGFITALSLSMSPALGEEFRIEFTWDATMKECFSKESPEIKLFNVPKGTTELRVKMVDKDAPQYPHGGGKLAYQGESSIPKGALNQWKGPCPPSAHTYEFRVDARAGKKKVGKAKYAQKYPPE